MTKPWLIPWNQHNRRLFKDVTTTVVVTKKRPRSRNTQGKSGPNSSEIVPIYPKTSSNVPTSGLPTQPAASSGNPSSFGMPTTAALRKRTVTMHMGEDQ